MKQAFSSVILIIRFNRLKIYQAVCVCVIMYLCVSMICVSPHSMSFYVTGCLTVLVYTIRWKPSICQWHCLQRGVTPPYKWGWGGGGGHIQTVGIHHSSGLFRPQLCLMTNKLQDGWASRCVFCSLHIICHTRHWEAALCFPKFRLASNTQSLVWDDKRCKMTKSERAINYRPEDLSQLDGVCYFPYDSL